MPRIEADSTDVSPENGAPPSRLTFGVRFDSEWTSVRPLLCMVSAVKAVIAIGTFWMFSLRFSAVTTISSIASANTADPISVKATVAAAEPIAKRKRRAFAGRTFPSSDLIDIPIPPMTLIWQRACLHNRVSIVGKIRSLLRSQKPLERAPRPHLVRFIHHQRWADSIESELLFVLQGTPAQSGGRCETSGTHELALAI